MRTDVARRERFEAVAATVYEPLQRYLARRAAAVDADEVFNDTLLVIWRRLDDLPASDPLPWCYGAARRCLANHRRGMDRRFRLVDRLAAQPGRSSPDAAAEVDRSDPELLDAMATLSAAEGEIVGLWAWEQLEPREIALVVGSTPNAVSVALNRARRKLADRLGRQDAAGGGQVPRETDDRQEDLP